MAKKKQKPELLGDMKDITKPDIYDEDSIRKLQNQIQARSERIAQIPDHEVPMDFHIYGDNIIDGCIENIKLQ